MSYYVQDVHKNTFYKKNKWISQSIRKKYNKSRCTSKQYMYDYNEIHQGQKCQRKKFKIQGMGKTAFKEMAFDFDDFVFSNKHENYKQIHIRPTINYNHHFDNNQPVDIESKYNQYYLSTTKPETKQKEDNEINKHIFIDDDTFKEEPFNPYKAFKEEPLIESNDEYYFAPQPVYYKSCRCWYCRQCKYYSRHKREGGNLYDDDLFVTGRCFCALCGSSNCFDFGCSSFKQSLNHMGYWYYYKTSYEVHGEDPSDDELYKKLYSSEYSGSWPGSDNNCSDTITQDFEQADAEDFSYNFDPWYKSDKSIPQNSSASDLEQFAHEECDHYSEPEYNWKCIKQQQKNKYLSKRIAKKFKNKHRSKRRILHKDKKYSRNDHYIMKKQKRRRTSNQSMLHSYDYQELYDVFSDIDQQEFEQQSEQAPKALQVVSKLFNDQNVTKVSHQTIIAQQHHLSKKANDIEFIPCYLYLNADDSGYILIDDIDTAYEQYWNKTINFQTIPYCVRRYCQRHICHDNLYHCFVDGIHYKMEKYNTLHRVRININKRNNKSDSLLLGNTGFSYWAANLSSCNNMFCGTQKKQIKTLISGYISIYVNRWINMPLSQDVEQIITMYFTDDKHNIHTNVCPNLINQNANFKTDHLKGIDILNCCERIFQVKSAYRPRQYRHNGWNYYCDAERSYMILKHSSWNSGNHKVIIQCVEENELKNVSVSIGLIPSLIARCRYNNYGYKTMSVAKLDCIRELNNKYWNLAQEECDITINTSISYGAIIVLEVDMDQHTLKFHIDNIQQGLPISIRNDIEYWPVMVYEYPKLPYPSLPFDYCPKYRLISCE